MTGVQTCALPIWSIEKEIGVNVSGKGLEDVGENEERTRISRIDLSSGMEKYEITGNVKDINSWKLVP